MFCQRLDFIHVVGKCKFNFLKEIWRYSQQYCVESAFRQTADCMDGFM